MMVNWLLGRNRKIEERIAEFKFGQVVTITRSPKFRGQNAIIIGRNGDIFEVMLNDGSIRKYSYMAIKGVKIDPTQPESNISFPLSRNKKEDDDK